MRILVTGGAGFIGSHLVRQLVKNGHRVINLDALRYSGNLENLREVQANSQYTFVNGDICDQPTVAKIFEQHRPEAVIDWCGGNACRPVDSRPERLCQDRCCWDCHAAGGSSESPHQPVCAGQHR